MRRTEMLFFFAGSIGFRTFSSMQCFTMILRFWSIDPSSEHAQLGRQNKKKHNKTNTFQLLELCNTPLCTPVGPNEVFWVTASVALQEAPYLTVLFYSKWLWNKSAIMNQRSHLAWRLRTKIKTKGFGGISSKAMKNHRPQISHKTQS